MATVALDPAPSGPERASIRARRHPGALAGLWVWQGVVAFLAACPFFSLARAAYGRAPGGDAPLWEAGGLPLLDLLWHETHGVTAAARSAAAILVVGAFAGLMPMGCLMAAMVHGASGRARLGLPRALLLAAQAFPALAVLLVVVGAGQGLGAAAAWMTEGLVENGTRAGWGEVRAQLLGAALAAPFVLAVVLLGVLHDVSRAAVLRWRLKALPALVTAMRAVRRRPLAVFWAWAWRGGLSLLCVAAGAAVAARLGGRGGAALIVLGLVHQAIAGARVVLRASWLASALRAVDAARLRSPYFDPSER